MVTTEADIVANLNKATRSNDALAEIQNQGFPNYMIYSFLEAARSSRSIIISRVPGSAGFDLIKSGYDLKGFHIKAKSCNWGPMAGFICQLPCFNKSGKGKISFNTQELCSYLVKLGMYSLDKTKILNAATARDLALTKAAATTDLALQKTQVTTAQAAYDTAVNPILSRIRAAEAVTGQWGGENTLEDLSPFIPLKRSFVQQSEIAGMRGVIKTVTLATAGLVYCTAQNVADGDDATNVPSTVTSEFILRQNGTTGVWDIFHGRIFVKNQPADTGFTVPFPGPQGTACVEPKVLAKYPLMYPDVLALSADTLVVAAADVAKIPVDTTFGQYTGPVIFYRVNGVMNPFPPYKKKILGVDNPSYCLNAVSGDYDLFAVWPKMDVPAEELVRQSEYSIGLQKRMGGKIFTTYLGNKANFAIEFTPGFAELTPAGGVVIESLDYGNIHNQIYLVAGLLNSLAATFYKIYNPVAAVFPNKAFHSDEGGRPGVIEIEFPIAVFLPEAISTAALNNVEVGGKIPPLTGRATAQVQAALVKTPAELVAFILEVTNTNYRVMMHYGWIIHLLYNVYTDTPDRAGFKAIATAYQNDILKLNPAFTVAGIDFSEFSTIDNNNALLRARLNTDAAGMAAEAALYLANLKKILTCYKDNSVFFSNLTKLFLGYTFQRDKPSLVKRIEVESLMSSTPVIPGN